jgi:heme-degrading monooxygenase HmoA
MYLHLELKTVPLDLRDHAIERLSRLHRLMSETEGFLSAQIWADVSDSLEYMVTRAWRDAVAHATYRASDAANAFAANRPPVPLWENTAVQEWDSTDASESLGTGSALVRAIDETGVDVMSAWRGSFRNLATHETGGQLMTLWRCADNSAIERIQQGPDSTLRAYTLIHEVLR